MGIIIETTDMVARSLAFEAKFKSQGDNVYSAYGPSPGRAEEKVRDWMTNEFNELSDLLHPKTSKLGLRQSIEDIIIEEADFDYNDDEIMISAETVNAIIKLVRSNILAEANV